MKVQGSGQAQAPSKAKKKGKASESDAKFGDFMTSGTAETGETKTTQSIAKVDALLAIQGAEDPTEGGARKQARQRADVLLNELDKVRMAMLNGNLTVGHMIDIADVVASHREKVSDPELTALIDEIDLRAQVELAKMRVVLDRQNPA